MRFLSDGDFGFPLSWPLFFVKQFFVWSYQAGATNPDGIIRMPGRLIDLAVFMLFGNLAFEYFYIFSSLAIVFLAFFFFAGRFLGVRHVAVRLIGALFFTLNPVFLGNLAKIGLVLAAAMLPLCLLTLQLAFERKKFRYFVFWILLLNVSLIHPFTFTVNAVVSGFYFLYLATEYKFSLRQNLPKLALLAGLALLLNAYFVLPLASMHTVSKNALTSSVATAPTNYTALVNTLNTGDIFTGLSLSKNVVIDFSFYDSTYQNFYFLGVFMFYALLIGLYVRVEKRLRDEDKSRFALMLVSLLTLVLLATVTFLHLGALIDLLIQLPGGWAFRSPLKWQLYLPLPLSGMLVLLLPQVKRHLHQRMLYAGLGVAFILMNSFLCVDIYKKLLTPRSVSYFGALHRLNLNRQNMLFVDGNACFAFEEANPRIMTEFNQIMDSKNTQLKQTSSTALGNINLNGYDWLVSCGGAVPPSLVHQYNFRLADTFARGAIKLYANRTAQPYVRTAAAVFLAAPEQLGDKYAFATRALHQSFNVIGGNVGNASIPVTGLQDPFDNLTFGDIHGHEITETVTPLPPGAEQLYIRQNQQLYYTDQGSVLSFSTGRQHGYAPAPNRLNLRPVKKLSITYADRNYQGYQNLVPNASFAGGLWQKKVGDCYDYDKYPGIGMRLDKTDKSRGRQSLELTSSNHIACTGPGNISVKPKQQYLLSFDYQTPGGDGGYYIGFGDRGQGTISGRLADEGSTWHTFHQIITAPAGARSLQLLVDAYPNDTTQGVGIARYDNFRLAAIPDLENRFYLVGQPRVNLHRPASITFDAVNPARTLLDVRGASTPFYLNTSESYSMQWRLELGNVGTSSWSPLARVAAMPAQDHFALNGSMNGWYVDPARVCKQAAAGCSRNRDGSYNIRFIMEFVPQRWFYAGLAISGLALSGMIVYIVYDVCKDYTRKRSYRWHNRR